MSTVTAVVPAHNEEALIADTVRRLSEGDVEVIVVANGCTDRTAQRAREAGAAVLEIPEASKVAALNAAGELVRIFPVVYVDADVSVSGADLNALAERMHACGALAAAPKMTVRDSSSWWVQQYYAVWALTDYRSSGHIGSGVYMLSETGRERFDRFAPVIADDLFVQRMFVPEERFTPQDLMFSVASPSSLAALVRRNTRIAAGNRQLAAYRPDLAAPHAGVGARSLLGRVWRRPRLWVGFAVYSAVYAVTRLGAARMVDDQQPIAWNRDEASRLPTP